MSRILILEDEESVNRGLSFSMEKEGYEAGADDYIVKPFSLSVLILKVEAFFKRKMPGEKEIEIGIIAVRCREQCDGEQGSVFVVQIPYVGIDKYCD